jgi:hypothetical protein
MKNDKRPPLIHPLPPPPTGKQLLEFLRPQDADPADAEMPAKPAFDGTVTEEAK